MRVLAADDDAGIVKVLERYLRMWGYEAVLVRDGAEAWRVLKREDAPRIVILDWDMPGLSGVEVCRLLRSTPHGADAYVLVLTARQQKDDLIEALEAGADDFLSEPFHARELQLRLAKGVSSRESSAKSNAPSRSAPPSGSTLGGKYRLEKKIAEGGMATVWLGVHLSLGINVAIKFMKPELAESADYQSFEREARAAAELRNEHIVRVYDHGITHDGLPYLVMEYLAGESLASRVEQSGPLSAGEVATVVEQVARALAEAHARGIVHRDVKPENVLLVEDPDRPYGLNAKLIDFGLAKRHGRERDDDATAGTPCYMSPEHLRAEAPPNAALDLWGLAVTTFTALTGVVAFDGAALADVYERVCLDPLPIPSRVSPSVPPRYDAWFARACARDPIVRWKSASELAASLVAVCKEGAGGPGVTNAKGTTGFANTEPYSGITTVELDQSVAPPVRKHALSD